MNAVNNKLNKKHKTINHWNNPAYIQHTKQSMVTKMNKERQTIKPGNFYKHKESKMGCLNAVAHILSL